LREPPPKRLESPEKVIPSRKERKFTVEWKSLARLFEVAGMTSRSS
jgi:hypothetical protein